LAIAEDKTQEKGGSFAV